VTQTLAEAVQAAEQERTYADRALSDAQRDLDTFEADLKARGGSTSKMTEDQAARLDTLVRNRRDARDAAERAKGKLEALRQVQAEEDEYQRQASVAATTGAVRGAGNYDLRPGQAVPARSATAGPQWVRAHDRRPATVGRSERFADHEVVAEHIAARAGADQAVIGQHGSLGQLVRAMSTTSGSAIVPQVWLADVVDRARNLSAVLRAGAEIVPMDTKQVNIGRLTGDPTVAFRTEGSTITASDPVFDSVVLDSKTLSTLVVGSLEWFQDASNADVVVENAIAQAIATHLDLMCLFGGLTTGDETAADALNATYPTPPSPRGVLATLLAVAASSVLGGLTNGTTQTAASFFREVQNAIYAVKGFNEAPNAILWPAKLEQMYVDSYDTTQQPLQMPANITELERFVTNQIPAAMTPGTGTNMADLFVADWSQLLVGQRLDLVVQTLTERYAENGQVGIVAHWRGDVALARPRAFSVFRYLKAAA
jgi:HK97 family phage major capsid protein